MNDYQFDWLEQINQMIKVFNNKQHKKPLSKTQFTLSNKHHHKYRSVNPPDALYQFQTNIVLNKIDINNLRITQNPIIDQIGNQPFQYGYIAINVHESRQKFILLSKDEATQASIYGLWVYGVSKRQDLLWNVLVQYVTNFQINKRSIFKQKTGLIFVFEQKKRIPQKPQQYLFEFPNNIRWTLKTQPTIQIAKSFLIKDLKNISFAQQNSLQQELARFNHQQKPQEINYFLPSFKQKDSSIPESDQTIKNTMISKYQDKRQQMMKLSIFSDRNQYETNEKAQQSIVKCEEKFKKKNSKEDDRYGAIRELEIAKRDNKDLVSQTSQAYKEEQMKDKDSQWKYQLMKDDAARHKQTTLIFFAQKQKSKSMEQELSIKLNKYSSNIQNLSQKYQNNYCKQKPMIFQNQSSSLELNSHIKSIAKKYNNNQILIPSVYAGQYKSSMKHLPDKQKPALDKLKEESEKQIYKQETPQTRITQYANQLQKGSQKQQFNTSTPLTTIPKIFSNHNKSSITHQDKEYHKNQTNKDMDYIDSSKANDIKKNKNVCDSDSDDQQLKKITSKYKKK